MADPKRRGLGKGLDALFDEPKTIKEIIQKEDSSNANILEIKIDQIQANPYQPRKIFDDKALNELSQSIKQDGVIQPIIVRSNGKKFQIVSGERRFRASQLANLKEIPAIIRDLTDHSMMEIAIIENLQREDLNAIEEAQGINSYIKTLNLTQEQAAEKLGKSRASITNLLRLLNLPPEVQELVIEQKISMGHARALLSLTSQKDINDLAKKIVQNGYSVRQVEELVQNNKQDSKNLSSFNSKLKKPKNIFIQEAIDQLEDKLATKVDIKGKAITINYHDQNDLNRLLDILGVDLS
ncbi:MAG: ParB/RepB/Spo0J family partition protein [Lactobacillaceae bacterium]|jgi:ParB family chromosome partitioning protein|nr:ParB/RepB/Spo0J family partition protein [Lactobacillaceae bacterium]